MLVKVPTPVPPLGTVKALVRVRPAKVGDEAAAISCGSERVGVPVAEETVIWLAVPVRLVTPMLVMVTAPVAPETEMPVPGTLEVTPVLAMAPAAEILMPVLGEKPILVLAEEVEVRSERLLAATSCRALETEPRPMLVRAELVLVKSDKLLAATSCRALETLPKPILVLAVEVLFKSERLLATCKKVLTFCTEAVPRLSEELEKV